MAEPGSTAPRRSTQTKSPNLTRKQGSFEALDYDDPRVPGGRETSGVDRVRNLTGGLGDGNLSQQVLNERQAIGGFGDGNEIPRLNRAKTDIGSKETQGTDEEVTNPQVDDFIGLTDDSTSTSSLIKNPVTSGQGIKIKSNLTNLNIPDNTLLDYVNLQYHIVLSVVPGEKVAGIQRIIPSPGTVAKVGSFDDLQRSIVSEGSIPLASTGDVFQSNSSQFQVEDQFGTQQTFTALFSERNYYNIQSVNFESTTGPRPANLFVNAMLTGRIILVEPHGFKFKEDVQKIGNKIGYDGINPGRFLYRMDIFFSGYNQDTGEWHSFIEMDTRVRKTKILTYYINFTTVEAKVDHTGTTYDISYAPSGHVAYRPEEIIVNSGAVATGDRSRAETFGGFLKRMASSMETAVRERTHDQVKRKYEFKAPQALLDAPFFTGNFEYKKGFIANDPKKGSFLTPARDVNVIGIVEEALQDLEFVWNEFLKKSDKKHLKPRIHWGIRFNVVFDSGPNPGTGDYDLITIQYIIEPFVTYKNTRINNRSDLVEVMDVSSQSQRVEEMLKFGMVNRIYNYINTAENTEVIELDIALKAFYYHTMYKPKDSPAGAGSQQSEGAWTKSGKRTTDTEEVDEIGTSSSDRGEAVPSNQENTVDSTMRRLFGSQIDNPTAVCDPDIFRTPFDRYGGGFGEMPTSDFTSMVGSSDINERDEYKANLNDHIKNDLITITMDVRGDPLWLLNPYGIDSGNLLSIENETGNSEESTLYVQPQSSRCFFLRMFAPNQNDYMDPERSNASTGCSVIGGFYEVFKVTSKFEGGKFTQTLEANKMHHLNYIENFIGLISNSGVDTSNPSSGDTTPQRSSRPSVASLASLSGST